MRVLVVCSYKENLPENVAPFVMEQKRALQRCGVACDLFLVKGKGVRGYLKQRRPLAERISVFQPDVIHAHFGLCGLLANLQRKVPVVTTYHGSDINDKKVRRFSKIAMFLSAWNVFVSRKTLQISGAKKKYTLLPCGIDLSDLQLTPRAEARKQMGLEQDKKYILFAGAFDNAVKNAPLARETVALIREDNVELLELKGYSREEVTLLMCASDALLMTSLTEGSPQVIKEAMACGCPVVSVDVGDVKERMIGVDGCYIAHTREPKEIANLLNKALSFDKRTRGREKVLADGLDNGLIAERLVNMYNRIMSKKRGRCL